MRNVARVATVQLSSRLFVEKHKTPLSAEDVHAMSKVRPGFEGLGRAKASVTPSRDFEMLSGCPAMNVYCTRWMLCELGVIAHRLSTSTSFTDISRSPCIAGYLDMLDENGYCPSVSCPLLHAIETPSQCRSSRKDAVCSTDNVTGTILYAGIDRSAFRPLPASRAGRVVRVLFFALAFLLY